MPRNVLTDPPDDFTEEVERLIKINDSTVVLETTVAAESEDIIQKGEFLSFPSLDLPLCEVSRLWERDNSDQEPAHTRTLQAIYHDAIEWSKGERWRDHATQATELDCPRLRAHIVDYASEAKYE
ncbi:hypothetical protein EVAR_27349_1 [Eumeta japonica]|uniref:Uncharacterized protein n=1 Tax=Eumeta variegata TaxID=151549 RepID=A0A4C1UDW8_EUMVA|nr:hypothetical protein EVAR_27349_1 [Eumeta japonica]